MGFINQLTTGGPHIIGTLGLAFGKNNPGTLSFKAGFDSPNQFLTKPSSPGGFEKQTKCWSFAMDPLVVSSARKSISSKFLPYNLKQNGKKWEVPPFLPRFY